MDASAVSRVLPPSDVFTPRTAASAPHLENDTNKTVMPVKDTGAAALNERRQQASQEEATESKHERRYELQDQVFVLSVYDKTVKVAQFPSEEAVKMRAYLAQQEAVKNQRREDAQKAQQDIVA
jgi:hypothetical protein